jgi:hypothetical protein
MDLGNPWALFSGVLIGIIGTALVVYGKKQLDLRCLLAGILMCVLPCIVGSVAAMWALAAACLGGLYAWSRLG